MQRMPYLDKPVVIWWCAAGLFASGIVFSILFSDGVTATSVAGALSYLGSMATLTAAIVAISAVSDWRSQFRHSEKYNCLKALKVAAENLRSYRALVSAMEQRHLYSMMNGGADNQEAVRREESARSAWVVALQTYSSAWTNAAVFLSDEELARVNGSPFNLASSAQDGILSLSFQYANYPDREYKVDLIEVGRVVKSDFGERLAEIQVGIEQMLKSIV
ncbi:hypothetical protein LMK08_12225 [Metapseudomonas furukawaii]|uniref:hypothetical protein n=1 Tax=Metapseudomonas furukawaii TaxID=1149133 RepID=UPI00227C45A4|nr:hypothetical protein [Pseudomonas furukawaii]WAG81385.1 hypothetical protein LMK08_12225 [Pseudomonas furukawaii]